MGIFKKLRKVFMVKQAPQVYNMKPNKCKGVLYQLAKEGHVLSEWSAQEFLEARGHYYSGSTVGRRLRELAREGRLKRTLRKNKAYFYI